MNILHHKSWHVRNKDNIQRVKRDEAKQAAEEKEKLRRKEIAESEARLDILRTKAGKKSKLVEYEDFLNQKNVNLFEEEELQKNKDDKNEEAEKEKAEEKEKFEKKVGLLKYLVDDEVLDLKNQPWYKTVKKSKKSNDDEEDDDLEIDLKRKHRLDPMTQVNELLKDKKKDKKKSEHKKHKKDHHKGKDEKPTTSKVKTIEQLRAERLKRESEERLKAQRLITGVKDDKKQESKVEADDRKRRYNNQFNPDFSKF